MMNRRQCVVASESRSLVRRSPSAEPVVNVAHQRGGGQAVGLRRRVMREKMRADRAECGGGSAEMSSRIRRSRGMVRGARRVVRGRHSLMRSRSRCENSTHLWYLPTIHRCSAELTNKINDGHPGICRVSPFLGMMRAPNLGEVQVLPALGRCM